MLKPAALVVACVGIAACAAVRMERTSDELGDTGPRWAVLSFTADNQAEAQQAMRQYCSPGSYRITADQSTTDALLIPDGPVIPYRRTYLRFFCVPPAPPDTRDAATRDFSDVRLPAALRAQNRDPAQFKQDAQRLSQVQMPSDRQKLMMDFLIHRAVHGPEILIQIVDAPMEYLRRVAAMPPDALMAELQRMDGAISGGRPIVIQ